MATQDTFTDLRRQLLTEPTPPCPHLRDDEASPLHVDNPRGNMVTLSADEHRRLHAKHLAGKAA